MKKASKAQKWARERNSNKGQLNCVKHILKRFKKIATEDESIQANIILSHVDKLLNSYKENNELSKAIYLKKHKG